MPYYTFKCKNTGVVVEVQRSINDRDVPPTEEELPMWERSKEERDWERRPPTGTIVTYKQWPVKGNP